MVGWPKPIQNDVSASLERIERAREKIRTLDNLLSAVDLGKLLFHQLVTLLADLDNLCAGDAELGDLSQDLLGDLTSGLVLGQSIRVTQRVICGIGQSIFASIVRLRCVGCSGRVLRRRPPVKALDGLPHLCGGVIRSWEEGHLQQHTEHTQQD